MILIYFHIVLPQIVPFDFGDEAINSGDLTSVMCSISKGDLPVAITWQHNNKTIDESYGVSITQVNKKISTLSIDSVQAHNIGEYTCSARNKAGTSSYSTFLHVNGTFLVVLFMFY